MVPSGYSRCQVIFSKGLPRRWRPREEMLQAPEQLDASLNVLRCLCTKAMGGGAGVFELDLTYDRRALAAQYQLPLSTMRSWNQILREGNAVAISFSRGRMVEPNHPAPQIFVPGTDPLVPWMLGFIDSVQEGVLISNDKVTRTIKIKGRDYARMFESHELHWQLATQYVLGDKEAKSRIERSLRHFGPPRDMIRRVMEVLIDDLEYPDVKDRIIFKPDQFPTPEGARFPVTDLDPVTGVETLDPRCGNPRLHGYCPPTELWDRGRFTNFLERFNDPPFTELFTDTRPDGYFGLYLRPTPFEREDWEKLPSKVVPDSEILGHQVLRIDVERINQISVFSPWLNNVQQDVMFMVLKLLRWDRYSFENGSQHHGVRRFPNESPYNCILPDDTMSGLSNGSIRDYNVNDAFHNDKEVRRVIDGDGPMFDFLRTRLETLWRRYSQQHRLYQGRFTLRGDPFWRIGYRLDTEGASPTDRGTSDGFMAVEDERRWYYVHTVAMEWHFGAAYRTHIGVIRGCPKGIIPGESLPTDGTEYQTPWSEERQAQAFQAVQL